MTSRSGDPVLVYPSLRETSILLLLLSVVLLNLRLRSNLLLAIELNRQFGRSPMVLCRGCIQIRLSK